MSTPRFAVTRNRLAVDPLVEAVSAVGVTAEEGTGAVVTFLGLVRGTNLGRRVRYLEYEAHDRLAVTAFGRIAEEARERWPLSVLAIHHRTGRIEVGEASVAIAAAAPHRAEAYASCRYAIERVKQIAPVWKHEFFEGGDVWIEGATADPRDEAARREALRRACA